MEQVEVVNQTGKVVKSLQLPLSIAQSFFSPFQLSLVYRSYKANQHQATAKVKTRGEVKGSTRKIYRQKGTGGARHGSRYAPQFRGGGVAFGPTIQKSQPLKVNQKLKKKVLASVVREKFQQNQVRIVEQINLLGSKTKEASQLMAILVPQKTNILLILTSQEKTDPKIIRSFRNLSILNKISDSQTLNLGEILNSDYLIFTAAALTELTKRLDY